MRLANRHNVAIQSFMDAILVCCYKTAFPVYGVLFAIQILSCKNGAVGYVKHPCSVCLKGVGVNSIRCTQCVQLTIGHHRRNNSFQHWH